MSSIKSFNININIKIKTKSQEYGGVIRLEDIGDLSLQGNRKLAIAIIEREGNAQHWR